MGRRLGFGGLLQEFALGKNGWLFKCAFHESSEMSIRTTLRWVPGIARAYDARRRGRGNAGRALLNCLQDVYLHSVGTGLGVGHAHASPFGAKIR